MTIYGADISVLPAREREQIATNLEFNLADMEKAAEKMFGEDGLLRKLGVPDRYVNSVRYDIRVIIKDVTHMANELRTEEGT